LPDGNDFHDDARSGADLSVYVIDFDNHDNHDHHSGANVIDDDNAASDNDDDSRSAGLRLSISDIVRTVGR
jgi:hypothetical protein